MRRLVFSGRTVEEVFDVRAFRAGDAMSGNTEAADAYAPKSVIAAVGTADAFAGCGEMQGRMFYGCDTGLDAAPDGFDRCSHAATLS